jgi:hypothetical protein
MLCLKLELFLKIYLIFHQKYGYLAKYGIRPDIRYLALTGYPARYPVSGFWSSWISGRPDIRQKKYPVHPYWYGRYCT